MFWLLLRTLPNRNLTSIVKNCINNCFLNCSFSKVLNAQLHFSNNGCNYLLSKFHTSGYVNAIIFRDTENKYAYEILQKVSPTNPELFNVKDIKLSVSKEEDFNALLDQDWRAKTATEIVDGFKNALMYSKENDINISDPSFDKLVDGLMDRVENLTDSELTDLLVCLAEYPLCESFNSHNFHDVWSALDDVCCWRLPHWSKDTQFLFAELWYRLNLGKVANYNFQFVEWLSKKLQHLGKAELLYAFFYINVNRKGLPFAYEEALAKHISTYTVDEIAVIAMAFFKSQSRLRVKVLLGLIIQQLKRECQTVHEISLTAILKVLRYSSHVLMIDQLLDLLDHIVPEINRLSNLCCIHIALLGTTLQFFHEKSLTKVTEKILREITDPSAVRLKDMERLLVALTMFDFTSSTSENIYSAIYKELHTEARKHEALKYFRCLPSALNLLTIRNIYSYELMNDVLNMDNIYELYGKSPKSLPRDLLCLDISAEVECPDYKGNRLDENFRRKATKWVVEFIPSWDQPRKIKSADKFILELTDCIAKIVNGHDNLHSVHILPSYVKSDIIVCKNGQNQFISPFGLGKYVLGDIIKPPTQDVNWFAIVPVNWNNVIKNTSQPLGLIKAKCRQLQKLGYTPVLIPWNEFLPLKEEERMKYVRNRLG